MAADPAPVVHLFDLRAEPHELAPREWRPRSARTGAEIVGVALHQWDTPVGTTPWNRLRFGESLALARRALGVPYTICAGVTQTGGEGVVSIAHPLERYTNASDAGNRHWISVGVMGRFPFSEDRRTARHTVVGDVLRAAVDLALRTAVRMVHEAQAREAGLSDEDAADLGDACGSPLALITHRQCANGQHDHFACPGEAVVEMALASQAVRDGALMPEPDRVLLPAHGLPWPDAWRRHVVPQLPLRIA